MVSWLVQPGDEDTREEHGDRLRFLGRSTAALAHEVNNPVQSTQLALACMERAIRDAPELQERLEPHLAHARESVEHIAALVRETIGYGRGEAGEVDELSLGDVAEGALLLLRGRARVALGVVTELGERAMVRGERTRLVQVAVNLISNAMDAAGAREEGRVVVRTKACPGTGRVALVVEDNGPGVPDEILGRLFQPFVSGSAGGAGLGLWISRRIAEDHFGVLEHDHTPDGATRFALWLPAQ